MTTRPLRLRLALLPVIFAVLAAPVYLRTSSAPAAEHDLHGGLCSNLEAPREPLERIEPAREMLPHSQPSCVQCRAPLLNAPLAQLPREAPAEIPTSPAA